jgi:hypothetical protein
MDPIPGSNATAYAYPLDPINLSDVSGMEACELQCTATISQIQPVATIQNYSGSAAPASITIPASRTISASITVPAARVTSAAPPEPKEITLSDVTGEVINGALQVAAVPVYFEYYAAYTARHALNEIPGEEYSLINLGLLGVEAIGLGGDVSIDWLKGESIDDEGQNGCILPLHRETRLCGAYVYLPGVDANGNVEW